MRNLTLIFLIVLAFANCRMAQTQQGSENISQPTPPSANAIPEYNGYHAGYARFTTSDKQYLGCWKTVKEPEVVNYELRYFQITDKAIQISKMPKPVSYIETTSNPHKDYFILQLANIGMSNQLQPYFNINMISDDEMTIANYPTIELYLDPNHDQETNYWALKREDCQKVIKRLKK
jgi:hypothetical protein